MNPKCAANIKALKLYNTVGVQTGIEDASPYRLIQMLLDGALGKISRAKSHMKQNEIEEKGVSIGMAISIIGGLRDSLDHKAGGDIAANLDNLYEYMTYRLTEANIRNSHEILDEVSGLLVEIKSAWDGIAGHELTARSNETTQLMQNTG